MVLDALDPQGGSTRGFSIDGATWAAETGEQYENSTLVDLSGSTPVRGITVPGILMNAVRIR